MALKDIDFKLTAIIVDDELHGRENLKKIIELYCTKISVLATASSVIEAVPLVNKNQPDVVFLDINMPVLDGFDFLDEFIERDFMVVFVSAHEEFGINAVKAGVTDYLLKPINIKELKACIKKLCLLKSKKNQDKPTIENNNLLIPTSHGFNVLKIDDIIRLEADGCYTTIYTKDTKQYVVSRTLKDFENSLPKNMFFRIHKSHLIGLRYIKDYSNLSGNYVTMMDASKIEISRRKAPEFLQHVKTFLTTL